MFADMEIRTVPWGQTGPKIKNGGGGKLFIAKGRESAIFNNNGDIIMYCGISPFRSSIAAFLLIWAAGVSWAQSSLKIYHIDIGQGDSTLIIAPNKTAMLIDAGKTGTNGGATPTHLVNFINGKISGGEITDFKYVLCSHYDADHIGGMDEVILNVSDTPQYAYDRGGSNGTQQYQDYINAIASKGVTRNTIGVGEVITLDGSAGVTAQCIAVNGQVMGYGTVPGANEENELSIALLLKYNGFDCLFLGDLTGGLVSGEANVEVPVGQQIKNNLKRGVDILMASHHGSHTGSNSTFLTDIRPENAIISCGETNPFMHPRQETLNRIESFPRALPDRPDLRPPDGTGVLNIFQTENGGPGSGTSPSQKIASTLGEGILVSTSNGINYTVQSFGTTPYHISETSFIADDVNAPNDIDGDGLRDTTEDKNGNGIVDGDTNGNGIVDAGETFSESNSRTGDTDADGISDGVEDCGSDGVPNILEPGFNPETNPDPHGDDYNQSTNPSGTEGNAQINGPGERTSSVNPDTDGDGLKDGQEDTNANNVTEAWETSPVNPDSDGDGVSDGPLDPDGAGPIVAGPDAFPLDPTEQWDTDGDGIGNNADTDDDGDNLLDVDEPTYGCNPLDPDTDDDGAFDGFEVENGFDPTDPLSYPKVIINEVLWNPDGDDDGKEYIELYNPQKSAIDVSGFIIQCGYTTQFYDNVFLPEGTVIPSNGYYLIAESSQVADINGYPPDLISDLELQNAGDGNADGVRLVSPTKATIFDCVLYGSQTVTLPTQGAATDKVPTEALISRVVPGWDNDLCRDFLDQPSQTPTSSKSHPRFPGVNVKINEVCYEPAGDDDTLEWIELYNPDDRTVDIGGFRIQSAGTAFTNNGVGPQGFIPLGTLMPPMSYYLIGDTGVTPTPDLSPITTNLQNGDQWLYYDGDWHYSPSDTDGVRLILPDNEKNLDVALDTILYDDPNTYNLPGDSLGQNLIDDPCPAPPDADPGFSLSRSTAGVDTNDTQGSPPYYDWEYLDNASMTPTKKYTDSDGDGIPDSYEPPGDPDGDTLDNENDTDSDGDTIADGDEDANQNGTYEADGIIFNGDATRYAYHTPKETNPYAADTDGDDLRDDFEIDGSLDPRSASSPYGRDDDPDDDGLTNYQEYLGKDGTAPALGTGSFDTDSTYPMNPDSDGDGMPDGWEVTNNLNPRSASDAALDPDSDGLTNLSEYVNGTQINDDDSDDDTMKDGWEVANSLDPLDGSGDNGASGDPDGDTLTNYSEYVGADGFPPGHPNDTGDSTQPLDADSDDDGLTDGYEVNYACLDPNDSDTDDDGMPDGWEVNNNLDPCDDMGNNGANGDPDTDGLINLNEYNGGSNSTDPWNDDCDGDGMLDGCEYDNGLNPNSDVGADGASGDPDGDGVRNLVECMYGSNAQSDQSDTDGINDYDEIVKYGSDPNDSSDPAGALSNEVLVNEFFAAPQSGQSSSDADGNGVGDSDADEFVELVNVSSHAVLLSGYRLTDSTNWDTYDKYFPSGTVLPAGEAIVVFDDSATPTGTFGYAQVTKANNDLGLNNSAGDVIKLWGAGGSVVVDDVDAAHYPSSSNGISKVLNPELSLGHNWLNHPVLSGKYCSPGKHKTGTVFQDLDADGQPNSYDDDDDGDGISDIWEIFLGSNPKDGGSLPADLDGDGNPDGDMINSETWMDTDDDDDGVSDVDEINYDGNAEYNPYDPVTNPTGTDLDVREWDTDEDGISDYLEVEFGSNPINQSSKPGTYRFNFQPAAADIPADYVPDDGGDFYQGYGWVL